MYKYTLILNKHTERHKHNDTMTQWGVAVRRNAQKYERFCPVQGAPLKGHPPLTGAR